MGIPYLLSAHESNFLGRLSYFSLRCRSHFLTRYFLVSGRLLYLCTRSLILCLILRVYNVRPSSVTVRCTPVEGNLTTTDICLQNSRTPLRRDEMEFLREVSRDKRISLALPASGHPHIRNKIYCSMCSAQYSCVQYFGVCFMRWCTAVYILQSGERRCDRSPVCHAEGGGMQIHTTVVHGRRHQSSGGGGFQTNCEGKRGRGTSVVHSMLTLQVFPARGKDRPSRT